MSSDHDNITHCPNYITQQKETKNNRLHAIGQTLQRVRLILKGKTDVASLFQLGQV